jgi:hypothetical protein
MINPNWSPFRSVRDSKDPNQLELPLDLPPVSEDDHARLRPRRSIVR